MFDLPAGVKPHSRLLAALPAGLSHLPAVDAAHHHHISQQVALGWLDRLAGALFGALKYLVIFSILLNLGPYHRSQSANATAREVSTSHLYGYALRIAPALLP